MSETVVAGASAPKAAKAKAAEEMVSMKDGRVVAFVGKRKMIKESFITDSGEISVRFDFRNGETATFVPPASLLAKFAAHGVEQKIGDETAGVEDVDDMFLYVGELMDRLQKGEWSAAREGGGVSGASVLVKALMELGGKTQEQVKAWLESESTKLNVSKQTLTNALRASDRVKPIVDRLEAEKAAKAGANIDAAGLLSGLANA